MAIVVRIRSSLIAGLALAAVSAASAGGTAAAPARAVAGALPPLSPMRDEWGSRAVSAMSRCYLPPAVTAAPRLADAARQRPIRLRPAAETPALPWRGWPAFYLTPSGALAYAASPDAARLVAPWRDTGADPPQAEATSDPALHQARRATTGAVPSVTHLPRAAVGQELRRADAARQQPLRVRSAADLPAVAWQSGVPVAVPYLAPSGMLACARSPDAALLVRPWRETGPDPDRPDATADPAQDHVRRGLLGKLPELRQRPAPFLRLAIPDPLELATVIRLAQQPPDRDAPAAATERPPRPVLATQPSPPAKK